MADWSDVGEAYAASFAALCAGAVDDMLDEAEQHEYRRYTTAAAGPDGRVTVPHRAVLVSGRPG